MGKSKKFSLKEKKLKLTQIEKFLKIISDKNRLKILLTLGRGRKYVNEIWQELNLPQNLVSYHLCLLKKGGLVSCQREGLKIYYRLNKKGLKKYFSLLKKSYSLLK